MKKTLQIKNQQNKRDQQLVYFSMFYFISFLTSNIPGIEEDNTRKQTRKRQNEKTKRSELYEDKNKYNYILERKIYIICQNCEQRSSNRNTNETDWYVS